MTVIVGYRPTPEGAAALDHAVREAQERRTSIVVVHSSEPPADGSGGISLEQDLDALGARLTAAGLEHRIRPLARNEDPGDALLEAATDPRRDVIVIGLRRRSPVGKLITGSVAQRVLLEAQCPVLAVKA